MLDVGGLLAPVARRVGVRVLGRQRDVIRLHAAGESHQRYAGGI